MRLLHPETIRIIAEEKVDFKNATSSKRQVLAHAWAEVVKFKAQTKSHPKMFIDNDVHLGFYMSWVYLWGTMAECKLNPDVLNKYPDLREAFDLANTDNEGWSLDKIDQYFDENYLFSDCVSLYYKGINIFPFVFRENWQKYCPVINLKEVSRQIDKTMNKK